MKPASALSPLGRHLREYRKRNRYSMEELATEAGLTKSYWWEIESTRGANPTVVVMMKLAKVTQTSLARVATLAAQEHMEPTYGFDND